MLNIYCDARKCAACGACEAACVARHEVGGSLLHALAVRTTLSDSAGPANGRFRPFPLRCDNCAERACVDACVGGAMHIDPITSRTFVEREKCAGCWSCVEACPSAALVPCHDAGKALKCDSCEGFDSPACVDACPSKALRFEELDEFEEPVGVRVIRG